MNGKTKIVVTGMGVISSIGIGLNAFWKNLLAGKSGISRVSSFDAANFRSHKAGEIKNFNPNKFMKDPHNKGRATQLLLAAINLAIKDAKIRSSSLKLSHVGVIIGTTTLDPDAMEEINQLRINGGIRKVPVSLIAKGAINIVSTVIGCELGLRGFVFVIPTACSAGNYAIGYGFDLIKQGKAKVVFCCGVDAFSRTMFTGFNKLRIVAPKMCQPFDKNRKGLMIGEGAGVLVLETLEGALERKACIYAEVLGYGLSCDAYSITISSKEGMKKVMEKTLENSRVKKEKVDYISAHGTGTMNNDRNEAKAIRDVFGPLADDIPVSSIKSMLGHTMGAASSLEAISCCLSIRDNIIPPTINYETPDPECNIDLVANTPRKKKINVVMNNSFAFGGNNACVIFGRLN